MSRTRSVVADEWLASGYAVYTRAGYSSAVRRFFAWCDSRGCDAFAVRRVDLDAYGAFLVSLGLAPGSVEQGLTAVRSFLSYAAGGAVRG